MTQVADAPVEIHWFDLRDPALESPEDLSSEERLRTSRLSTQTLHRRYTASHVALRRLLASRLGIAEPRRVALFLAAGVKPRLSVPLSSLTFSLSRSADIAAVALGDGVEVGIDVEADHPVFRSRDLHDAISTAAERAALDDLAGRDRASALQRLWVRKEAIVKALGIGFVEPPSSVPAGHPRDASGVETFGALKVRWVDLALPHEHAAAAVAWCASAP